MKIAVTGANGFIAKNLISYLQLDKKNKIFKIDRKTSEKNLEKIIKTSEIIFHLAGVNRPSKQKSSYLQNEKITNKICKLIEINNLKTKIIFSSSTKVKEKNNSYGKSKLNCEKILINLLKKNSSFVTILRLPNVFGKWSKPNYNSVVSTFCYNIPRKKSIFISKPSKYLELLYIDDLIKLFVLLKNKTHNMRKLSIIKKFDNTKKINLKSLSDLIFLFEKNRKENFIDDFNDKFIKNLYSTYVSYLPSHKVSYSLPSKKDNRGNFIEFLKSKSFGQISIFSAKKNKIRGYHFHNSKVEKFLVVKGKAKFIMESIYEKKKFEIILNSSFPKVIESVPGWVHYIKNIGKTDLIVLLWSNEPFDAKNPDTFSINEKN